MNCHSVLHALFFIALTILLSADSYQVAWLLSRFGPSELIIHYPLLLKFYFRFLENYFYDYAQGVLGFWGFGVLGKVVMDH